MRLAIETTKKPTTQKQSATNNVIRWRLAITLFVNSPNVNALTRLLLSMCD